ncbi:hypothetical protein HX785_02870 [Pseudomonas reactans]|uniref:hypothetical protein n=1 Tax=Pseudomonas reactans TaxID=117680 RepID=UPI00159FEFE4|nr:hypothetical protein [Pseudomonas reactans]NWF12616.1 hypothetical protein [Pseudomonas reactans]
MQLPEALQPWREWLEWFAPEHLPVFADLLGRLNPLLGPLRGLHQGGVPEPDGLGDLHRRGPYERLLSSEWLLADEVPDEFLRRAVGGEHMFLAPQYRAREASRLIVVLFDAGPLQLGAARLVHLALLMLLARRAQEAGAQLRWGILQGTPVLQELDSAAQLTRLLEARTYEVVSDNHWLAWRDALAEQTVGECWVVGQRLPPTDSTTCTHRVQITRNLDGRSLSFALQSRRVSLPMPDEQQAVRLLKGQFDNAVHTPASSAAGRVARVALTLPPVISGSGNYVALRLLDEHGMAVIKLPNKNQKKTLEVRRRLWGKHQHVFAAAFNYRSLGAVLGDGNLLTFWNIPGMVSANKPMREELHLPPGTATFLPAVWLRGQQSERLYLLDTNGQLAHWQRPGHEPRAANFSVTNNVMGLAQLNALLLVYARSEAGQLVAYPATASGVRSSGYAVGAAAGVSQILFASTAHWKYAFGGCALLTHHDGRQSWRLVTHDSFPAKRAQIDLAPGWSAIGLHHQVAAQECYSLVLQGPNQHTIGLYSEGQQQTLFTTSAPIARASFCPMSGLVAVLTTARELLVFNVTERAMRLQVMCDLKQEPAHA